MRVSAVVHFAAPWRMAGSEIVLHELMSAAHRAGHETRIWCTNRDANRFWTGREPDTIWDGVTVTRSRNVIQAAGALRRWGPDVVVSHHQHVVKAILTARQCGARSVYMVHNDMDLNRRPLLAKPDLVVFNSDWVRESLKRFGEPRESMTFHPPLTPDRHRVEHTGDCVTLVNLNKDKGAEIFYDLARAEPDRKFLGVVGGHGIQIVKRNLPNVTIMEHTPNMKTVWAQTRVLLMPSVYESYGLVAQEAGISGIPTIGNRTPGLIENLGLKGLFADRDHLSDWRSQLRLLDDPREYERASTYAQNRAEQTMDDTRDTLKTWCEWLG